MNWNSLSSAENESTSRLGASGDHKKRIGQELQVALSSIEHPLYFHGTSMTPFLQEGDLVVVNRVLWPELRPGDIVTYRYEDKFPTRRILRKQNHRISLCCDGWPLFRDQATPGEILGRVEARCRRGRWIFPADAEWRRATCSAMASALTRAAASKLRSWLRGRR